MPWQTKKLSETSEESGKRGPLTSRPQDHPCHPLVPSPACVCECECEYEFEFECVSVSEVVPELVPVAVCLCALHCIALGIGEDW